MTSPPNEPRRPGGQPDRRASGASNAPGYPLKAPRVRGLGLYAALFGGVLLLLLVAVVLQDYALRSFIAVQTERDAVVAAMVVDEAVATRVAAARGFSALFTDAGRVDSLSRARRFSRLVPVVTAAPPLFERLFVLDSRGRIAHDTTVMGHRPGESSSVGADDAAFMAEIAALHGGLPAPTPGTPAQARVQALRSRRGDVAIVVPLVVDGARAGTAIGTLRAPALASRTLVDAAPRRLRITLLAGADTLLARGEVGAENTRSASAPVNVRADQPWRVEVVHEDTARGIRATLWLLGSAALLFLVLGLVRERRQAGHVAERSAELERLSAELLRSNRMKSEFLANVSHELRTPLNAIVGFVELLRDGVYGELSPRQTNPVERIAGSATHLRHLVDQVLDIAKMAAGRLEVHLEPVVLRPFVLNVASELESLAADKGIVLSLTVGSSLPRVRTDPSHLRQILVNLVGNAIKYTPSGGAVAIRTRLVGGPPGATWRGSTPPARPRTFPGSPPVRTGEEETAPMTLATRSPDPTRAWVAVQVSDTGIGIAPADHERIFEEFEQVNAGPRGESMQRGTGLGLPISRRLARLLGGDVSVDSDVGKGATFTLWLPLEQTSG